MAGTKDDLAESTNGVMTVTKALIVGQDVSFLQVADISKMMGISRASAYTLVKKKGFPRIEIGSRIVIPYDLFKEWISRTAMSGRC